jgi:hypothetical protein
MDTENQAGTRGLKLAAARGLAVVIMEPLLGGRLANPPASIRQVIERSSVKRSPADWALQWLWDQPEVSVVLSGMSNLDQVNANLDSAAHARSHSFQAADLKLIADLQQKYRERAAIPCTKCNYCMPCPNGVNIPANFEIYNEAFLHEDIPGALVPAARRLGGDGRDVLDGNLPAARLRAFHFDLRRVAGLLVDLLVRRGLVADVKRRRRVRREEQDARFGRDAVNRPCSGSCRRT